MLENFRLGADYISLWQGESCFDLHNDYSLERLSYNLEARELCFFWCRRTEIGTAKLPAGLQLQLTGVYLFRAHERDPEQPYTEDDCLANIGFMWNSMPHELSAFAKHAPQQDCNHLSLMFQSGFAVKVGAKRARLVSE